MVFFSNPVLPVEENKLHSNHHINWNWSHQQCIQCCVAYPWSHRRDIKSPVCSHLILITVKSLFLFLKVSLTKVFFFISWKPYVVFVHLACHRWSTNLLDVDLIEENKLDGCQRWKFFFVVPGWLVPYFYLLPFVNNKQYGEVGMSRVVVFVCAFAFYFSLHLSPLEVCWAWSTIASLVNTLTLSNLPHSSYLVVFSEFLLF